MKKDIVARRMRAEYHGNVVVIKENQELGPYTIKNISLNGIFIETDHNYSSGEKCTLKVLLGDDGAIELLIDGEIARSDHVGVGIKFLQMGPATLDHLRKIVLYNTDNPEDFLVECTTKPGFK